MSKLEGKAVCVVGSGISGIGSTTMLEAVGADVILYDGNEKLSKETILKKLPEGPKAEVVLGAMPKEILEKLDLAVLSPGVPVDIPLVKSFKEQGIPVWGEIELAYQFSKGKIAAEA